MSIPGFAAELSLFTPMMVVRSQPMRASELIVAALKKGVPDIPDDPKPKKGPPVATAGTSAVCSNGVWHASTGTDGGSCTTKSDSKGKTTQVQCTDGKGNGALVNCSKNSGVGSCNTIGSGECTFQQAK